MRWYFLSMAEVRMPILPRIVMMSGSSNTKPNGSTNVMTKSKYLLTEKSASSSALPKPMKKRMPAGKTRKKEKASPEKNRMTDVGTMMPSTMRSLAVRAGRKKRHT